MIPLLTALLCVSPAKPTKTKNPRFLILIAEGTLVDEDLRWTSQKVPALGTRLKASGLRYVERQSPAYPWGVDEARLLKEGRKFKADVIVTNAVRLKVVEGAVGLTLRSTTDFVALDVRTGKKLLKLRLTHSARSADQTKARHALYEEWAKDVAEFIETKVVPGWTIQKTMGSAFRVGVSNVRTARQATKLVRAFEKVHNVVSVRLMQTIGTRVSLDVRYRGRAEELVRSIFSSVAKRRAFRGMSRVGRGTEPIELELR